MAADAVSFFAIATTKERMHREAGYSRRFSYLTFQSGRRGHAAEHEHGWRHLRSHFLDDADTAAEIR